MKSRTSSKFSQIRQPTAELAAIERVKNPHRLTMRKKLCLHFFSAIYNPILMILAGDDDWHKSLIQFEFGQDQKTDCRVSCPCASKE